MRLAQTSVRLIEKKRPAAFVNELSWAGEIARWQTRFILLPCCKSQRTDNIMQYLKSAFGEWRCMIAQGNVWGHGRWWRCRSSCLRIPFADVTFTSYDKVALHSDPQYSEGQRALEARAKTAEGDRRSGYTQFQHFLTHWPCSIIHHSNNSNNSNIWVLAVGWLACAIVRGFLWTQWSAPAMQDSCMIEAEWLSCW